MNEAHFVLIILIGFVLWSMNIIRLVPRGPWSEERAKRDLMKTILRDTNKGIFK